MKAGILTFPGSNCDIDLGNVLREFYGIEVEYLWHTSAFAIEHDLYFVPGGFSYGDYLRSGAMAAKAPSLKSLREASEKGRVITGICNGFQILTEAHLLPGALIRNDSLKHICEWVDLKGEGEFSFLPEDFALPVSHSEGNYLIDPDGLQSLEENQQIILRYRKNPNGSVADIAGIQSANGRIIGLMPHPERAFFPAMDYNQSLPIPGKTFLDRIFARV